MTLNQKVKVKKTIKTFGSRFQASFQIVEMDYEPV